MTRPPFRMTPEAPPLDPQVLVQHRDFMRAIARGLLADEHWAEDVVQQACATALERPPGSDVPVRRWLARVVRNFALKTLRRERQRPFRERLAARNSATEERTQTLAEMEVLQRLATAFAGLPEPYKNALYQRYYKDLGPRSIALRAGVSVETVKTRLRRGLKLLRVQMNPADGDRRSLGVALLSMAGPGRWSVPAASTLAATALQGIVAMKMIAFAAIFAVALSAVFLFRQEGRTPAAPAALGAGTLAGVPGRLSPQGASSPIVQAPSSAQRVGAVETPPPPANTAVEGAARSARLRLLDQDGEAVTGARVSFDGDSVVLATSDATGTAQFPLAQHDPKRSEHRLALLAEGFLPLRPRVQFTAAPTVELGTYTLIRGGVVRGAVVDRAGLGVPGAFVFAADPGAEHSAYAANVVSKPSHGGVPPHAVRSDAQGLFTLPAVQPGDVRIWAGLAGALEYGCSPILRVRAGRGLDGVSVRLDPPSGKDVIAGVVALPKGVEASHLMVWSRRHTWEGTRTRTTPVDPSGRFRIELEKRKPHDIWVSEDLREWDEERDTWTGARALSGYRAVVAEKVAPGTQDLVLTFETAPSIAVYCTDESAEPMQSFELLTAEFDGTDLGKQVLWYTPAQQGQHVSVPATSFYVSVTAEGHDRIWFGPYEPDAFPDRLDAALTRLAPVSGRVRAQGEPVPGARVELFAVADSEHRYVSGGFLLKTMPTTTAQGWTDASGAFAITLRTAGSFYVRASAPGWAAAELGPLELQPTDAVGDLELELVRGGAIEGRVLLPARQSPAGWVVGAGRGIPRGIHHVIGSDGAFRFEDLTPGMWWLCRLTGALESSTISSSRKPVHWEGNVHVVDGETTRIDLDFRDSSTCVLQGSLSIPGEDLSRWTATLHGGENPSEAPPLDSFSLGADGTFELLAEKPGEYTLDLRCDAMLVARRLRLGSGTNTWKHHVTLGALTGIIAPDRVQDQLLVYFVRDASDNVTAVRLEPDGEGEFRVARAPAGRGSISISPNPPRSFLLWEWEVLETVEVPAGESARVTIDS